MDLLSSILVFELSRIRVIEYSSIRVIEYPRYRVFELSSIRVIEYSSYRVFELSSIRVIENSSYIKLHQRDSLLHRFKESIWFTSFSEQPIKRRTDSVGN